MTQLKTSAALTAAYGLTALAGGIIGYVKANSLASLIAGGVSGLLLLTAAALIVRKPTAGLVLSLIVSLALLGRFAPGAVQTGKPVAVVMSVGALAVVILAARAWRARGATAV